VKNINNIEDLFKESFEHFEQEVDPSVWANVQQAIQTPAVPSADAGISNATITAKSAALKYAAITIVSLATATGIYFAAKEFTNNKKEVTPKEVAISEVQITVNEEPNKNETVVNNTVPVKASTEKEATLNTSENTTKTELQNKTNEQVKPQVEANAVNSTVIVPSNNTSSATEKSEKNILQNEISKQGNNQAKENKNELARTEVTAFNIDVEVNVLEDYDNKTIAFSIENEVEKVEWNFGDGSASTLTNGLHRYNSFGKYVVEITAWSVNGQKRTIKKTIDLQLKSSVDFVPNVITPNNDGSNDAFEIKYSNLQSFHIIIVDRLGNKIFETNNAEVMWNGNDMNGNPCASGTYNYIIKAIGTDNKTHNTNGTIQLLR
jgi:gliding motility-associated-like protein